MVFLIQHRAHGLWKTRDRGWTREAEHAALYYSRDLAEANCNADEVVITATWEGRSLCELQTDMFSEAPHGAAGSNLELF